MVWPALAKRRISTFGWMAFWEHIAEQCVCTHFVVFFFWIIVYMFSSLLLLWTGFNGMHDRMGPNERRRGLIHRTPNSHKAHFFRRSLCRFFFVDFIFTHFIYLPFYVGCNGWMVERQQNAVRFTVTSKSLHMPTKWVHALRFRVNRSKCVRAFGGKV